MAEGFAGEVLFKRAKRRQDARACRIEKGNHNGRRIPGEVVGILKGKAAEIFGADPATLSADTRFVEDLHCKSSTSCSSLPRSKMSTEVEVPFMELNKKKTFGEAAALVDEKLSM